MNSEPTAATQPLTSAAGKTFRQRTDASPRELLNVDCLNDASRRLADVLRARVIGQDQALDVVVCAFSRVLANLRDPHRPALSALLLGPTGVGKTETARAMAEALFGDGTALTRINCEEYAHGHEVAKLFGSPPGYVGFGTEPLLSQSRLEAGYRKAVAEKKGITGERTGRGLAGRETGLSIVLFDEIEKAHPVLWNGLLGILEGGVLTLGDGSTTNFTRSIVILTSNVGSWQLHEMFQRTPIGFLARGADAEPDADDLESAVVLGARETFPPEFLNRLDEMLVYSALDVGQLDLIFEKFLGDLHDRAVNQAGCPLLIKVTPEAKRLIITRGTNLMFGARPLRRAVDTELVAPLSRLIAARRVEPGDVIHVTRKGRELVFYRDRAEQDSVVA
jgi:ATP-dependent Clp protease ATP-binding subunit ClpA